MRQLGARTRIEYDGEVTAIDYYGETRRVAELLVRDGEPALAEQLIGCVEGGTTATEILMCVRFHLQQALDAGRTGGTEATARVRELVSALVGLA